MRDRYERRPDSCLNKAENKAATLAREYHERTEAYDRMVCTGPVGPDGGIMPATSEQRAAISRNAKSIRADIMGRAATQGISERIMQRAILNYRRDKS